MSTSAARRDHWSSPWCGSAPTRRLARRTPEQPPTGSVVNADVVEQAAADLEALLLAVARVQRIDSPIRLRTSVVSEAALPVQCAVREWNDYVISTTGRQLRRVRPIDV